MDCRLMAKDKAEEQDLARVRDLAKVLVRPYIRDLIKVAEDYGLTFQIRLRKAPGGKMTVHVGLED